MELKWFKQEWLFFIPKSVQGWILFILALTYAIYSFIEIDKRSHSVSDTLMNFVFRLMIIWVGYTLIAFLTSRSYKK